MGVSSMCSLSPGRETRQKPSHMQVCCPTLPACVLCHLCHPHRTCATAQTQCPPVCLCSICKCAVHDEYKRVVKHENLIAAGKKPNKPLKNLCSRGSQHQVECTTCVEGTRPATGAVMDTRKRKPTSYPMIKKQTSESEDVSTESYSDDDFAERPQRHHQNRTTTKRQKVIAENKDKKVDAPATKEKAEKKTKKKAAGDDPKAAKPIVGDDGSSSDEPFVKVTQRAHTQKHKRGKQGNKRKLPSTEPDSR